MRKYHQAALALTAAFSLIALMFYRHEYNKLRFVLHVFNYFGKPMRNGMCDNNCTLNTPISLRLDSHYLEPQSSWQRLSHNFYIYSSYRVSHNQVKTIAFGEDTDIINYSCKIHIENEVDDELVDIVTGDFSYLTIDNTHQPQSTNEDVYEGDETYSGFILSCKFKLNHNNNIRVTGVEYSSITSNKKQNEYVYQNVYTINEKSNKSDNAICIVPFDKSVPPRRMDMISFLSFNDYIGLNNFIVYDSGVIPHVFNSALRAMSSLQYLHNTFTYTTVIWNFPYRNIPNSIMRRIIETDCIYRTYNKAALAVTLDWNEYINIKYHSSLTSSLLLLPPAKRFKLKIVTFCTDQASHDSFNNSTPIILRATRRLRSNKNTQFIFIYKLDNNINDEFTTEENIDNLLVVNKYEKCQHVEDKRETVENGMLRFAEFTPNSQIFQYLITGKLFY